MSNGKFTPGPWEVVGHQIEAVGDFKEKRCSGYGCNNNFVCDLDDGEYHEYWDEAECAANAALIAAAPEMYRLLYKLCRETSHCPYCGSRLTGRKAMMYLDCEKCEINRVLKKARGEK